EEVIVVERGEVRAAPRCVRLWAFAQEPALQVKLGAPLDGAEDLGRALVLGNRREGGHALPPVQRPNLGGKAVPPAVRLLVGHNPLEGALHARVVEPAELGHHLDAVAGETDLAAAVPPAEPKAP